jgi:hypothetical protein
MAAWPVGHCVYHIYAMIAQDIGYVNYPPALPMTYVYAWPPL